MLHGNQNTFWAPIDSLKIFSSAVAAYSIRLNPEAMSEAAVAEWAIELPESLAKAALKRRAHFLAGRYCARGALKLAGASQDVLSREIPSLDDRSPVWPQGWTGSITHTDTHAAAVVAPVTALRSIGIDAESLIEPRVASEIRRKLLNPSEEAFHKVDSLDPASLQRFMSVVFAAKESLFKALHPLAKTFFGFHDAELEIDLGGGVFRWVLKKELSAEFGVGARGTGQFEILDQMVFAVVEIQ